jgi:hypothetical protein
VCNSYFCTGLGNFMKDGEAAASAVVTAAQGTETRTSPLLMP